MNLKIKINWLIILVTLYFICMLNFSFWRYISENLQLSQSYDYIFLISLPFFIFAGLYFIFSSILLPYITKPILIFLLISASMANYVMVNLGVYIDSDMIRNMVQTNQRETLDLITLRAVLWVGILGVVPSILLFFTRITYRSFTKELSFRLLSLIIAFLIIGAIAAISYKEYAAFGRNNRQIIRLINPTNYLYATARYFKKLSMINKEFINIDPTVAHNPYPDEYPTIFIIVLGETARTMNFSVNGYERETNPKLSKQNILSFQNVTSCGTATAISVPCMFSNMARKNYNPDQVNFSNNLLDLLQDSGYQILWRENDDGCKGVCNRVPTENMVTLNNPKYCDGTYCYDDVLLDGLEEYLSNITRDTVIVLHTMGSHGPTYYKRYPDAFKKFTPTCDTADIQNCSKASIVNTYDNTILYTDHIVSSTIDILKKFPQFESGLLYVSDHGESLGENNIYLHGIPYSITPKEQNSIPFILWLSETMVKEDYLDTKCLKEKTLSSTISHDYLFHSMLSLMEINSKTYDPSLDVFNDCRTKPLLQKGEKFLRGRKDEL